MLIDKLVARIAALQAPIVVGLDPRLSQIPACVKDPVLAERGATPEAAAEIFWRFNQATIDQIYDIVPAVKPQIAMYEQYGTAGLAAYAHTCHYAREKGLIVIGDIKRGDIASTAEAYSAAHLGRAEANGKTFPVFDTDFITVNPYMGYDSVEPYLADCRAHDKGLFVLVKTSNKGSADFQDLPMADGRPLYQHVGDKVEAWGTPFQSESGYSAIGAVVGATHPKEGALLRESLPHTFFLVPGYGAQGATAQDLKGCFKNGNGAIVNSSRGITGAYALPAYKGTFAEDEFAHAARQAVLDMRTDLQAVMG